MDTIRNPVEWAADQVAHATHYTERVGHSLHGEAARPGVHGEALQPEVRRIALADIRAVLAKGLEDFAACRTDVILICLVYPLAGLVIWRFAFQAELLPLLFPLAAGFALIGPAAAVGLYEMSRRRERGESVSWGDAFGVIGSPSFGAILVLALGLVAVFLLWLLAAMGIHAVTLGPETPASIGAFAAAVFGTAAGWAMIGLGVGVGFLFAVAVLAVSVVSFPLLLDRDVGLRTAVLTSVRAVRANPVPMSAWGLVVAGGLVVGSIPVFLGLIVVLPVLGHGTWHLYRRVIAR